MTNPDMNAAYLAKLPCVSCAYRNNKFCVHPEAVEFDFATGGSHRELDAMRAPHNPYGINIDQCGPRAEWFVATRAAFLNLQDEMTREVRARVAANDRRLRAEQEAEASWAQGCIFGGTLALMVAGLVMGLGLWTGAF